MGNNTSPHKMHRSILHKSFEKLHFSKQLLAKKNMWKSLTALLLLTLLFLCTTLFSHPPKSFATPADVTVTPLATSTDTPTPDPSPTVGSTPTQVPTVAPSPTVAATPKPTPRPQPTATPIPTIGVTATVATAPTVAPTQNAGVLPSPVPTKQPTATATATPTPPPAATAPITLKKTMSVTQNIHHDSVPVMPIMVGTLLTLCLSGVGFIGYRRVRTTLLPAISVKKTTNVHIGRPWQRIRTEEQPIVQAQNHATVPFTPLPESPVLTDSLSEGPRTGKVRRLGPVRLQSLQPQEPVQETEKEV